MTTYEKIKALCSEKGFSISDIGKHIDGLKASSASVTGWKKGAVPRKSAITLIANYFNKPIDYFADDSSMVNSTIVCDVPLFSSVSAGRGTWVNSAPIGTETVVLGASKVNNTFCIKVSGDSMYPTIDDEDIVQVEKDAFYNNGDIVVAIIDGEESYLKRYIQTETSITLESINISKYPPMTFKGEDMNRVSLMGKAVKVIKKL